MKCDLERDLYTRHRQGWAVQTWRPSVLQLDFIPVDG